MANELTETELGIIQAAQQEEYREERKGKERKGTLFKCLIF